MRTRPTLFATILVGLLVTLAACSSTVAPEPKSLRLSFNYKFGHPENDSLFPVFPNPFSRVSGDSVLNLRFTLRDSSASVHLLIQTVIGDEVASFSDSLVGPGTYSGTWNPIGSDGTALKSGLYFVTLRSPSYINSRLVNIEDNE